MLGILKFKKSPILKAYFGSIILISFIFIGLNLIAQVEDTPYTLPEYLRGIFSGGQTCPRFINVNNLTMKDECTGLIWARFELPTFTQVLDADPGYSWDAAKAACEGLVTVNNTNMFRLPTVEELLTLINYQCNNAGCSAKLSGATLDLTGDGVADMPWPYFSHGIYWTNGDFNESSAWTDPNAIPAGKSSRDYKRSVNLNNGEVDNPIFNKDMRLNAWCVVEHNQEVSGMEFTNLNTADVTGATGTVGQEVISGTVKLSLNRQCQQTSDCTTINADCDSVTGFCYQEIINVTLPTPKIVSCSPGLHVEGNTCVENPNDNDLCWRGNVFNGIYACELTCGNGQLDEGEDCDGTAGIATSPADSSITKQYACTQDCTFIGGYLGDTIINGEEVCDSRGTPQPCATTFATGLPAYCSGIPVSGLQSCDDTGTDWLECVATAPTAVGNSSSACASTSPSLSNYSCCELVSCEKDGCGCCGRTEGAVVNVGYNFISSLSPCSGTNESCKLSQSATNLKNWQVTTNHTTAYYRCWQ